MLTIGFFSTYSGYFEVDRTTKTTSRQAITKLKTHFARYGIPLMLISDSAPQFSATEFARFTNRWKIEHRMSSPTYPRSNGKADSGVKLAKNVIRKTAEAGTDLQLVLLELRNMPKQDSDFSPTRLMFGKQTSSLLQKREVSRKM